MLLKEKINADFMTAYKAKEMSKKNFLGLLKGAMQTQEGKLIPSTDENVLKMLKSFEKGLLETIEAKKKLSQDATSEESELVYLSEYLPILMSEDEVTLLVTELCSRDNVTKNQGFLMGLFNKEQKGKSFDNKMVSRIIQQKLSL